MSETQANTNPVRRRQVFYIPGFDPVPPRRYRELYRREGALQAKISGYRIDLGGRKAGGPFGWTVNASMDGHEVRTEFDVLVWSDIVQGSMHHGLAATYLQLLRTAWIYIRSGALIRLMRLRKGPIIAALYPIVMLLAQLAVAAATAFVLTKLVIRFVAWPLAWGLGPLLGLIAAVLVLRWFRALDHRLFAYYLMHDYAFTSGEGGAYPGALEARLAEFGQTIRAALAGDSDEVLVIGHSSGAHLAVSIVADLIRDGLPDKRPALGLMSLGQVVPMVSFLPRAGRLRRDLNYLSARDELAWVDVTAPGDGCAFALCDPVAVTGVAPPDKRWPLVLSAAFSQTLADERWKALRWRFFRLHFQYLCAFDRPGAYDYFRITAGPMLLATRFAQSQPSKSRIETPLSPYRDMMP